MARKKTSLVPVDLNQVKRLASSSRRTITSIKALGKPIPARGASDFFDALPKFLKANDLIKLIGLTHKARSKDLPFHLMLGAHTIKVGLSPLLIDLMRKKIVTGLSFNSAGLIHDLELAFYGSTSEDVAAGLDDGSFGMVIETAQLFAGVCDLAQNKKIGLGQAAGIFINRKKAKHRSLSLFAMAEKMGLPATIHIGIGTDTIAQHPEFDAAAAAEASHYDFRLLAAICQQLDRGGVVVNIGSAVILPEVFLKALTVARNLKQVKCRLTTANFDMIMHYRPMTNVVNRPTMSGGQGFNFVGHHEIMIPLLAWGLTEKFSGRK